MHTGNAMLTVVQILRLMDADVVYLVYLPILLSIMIYSLGFLLECKIFNEKVN